MRAAQELVEVHGRSVRVLYTPIDEMTVDGVGLDHETACILYQ
jgi:hypothetical protein